MCGREFLVFPHCVIFTLTWKISWNQSTSHYELLVKKLIWRNFLKRNVRVKFHNFHTVSLHNLLYFLKKFAIAQNCIESAALLNVMHSKNFLFHQIFCFPEKISAFMDVTVLHKPQLVVWFSISQCGKWRIMLTEFGKMGEITVA